MPEEEYISRKAAYPLAKKVVDAIASGNYHPGVFAYDILEWIDDIPAADVRPVVRGRWIPDYDYAEYDYDGSTPLPEPRKFQDGWQCSLCGAYESSKTNFCPNCGADMRETNDGI